MVDYTNNDTSVGAFVFNQNKGFLFLKRADKQDAWEFPKGHIEGDEKELETLRRELLEECSLTDYFVYPFFREISSYSKEGHERKIYVYIVKTNQEPSLSPEHKEYRWLSVNEVRRLLEDLIKYHNHVKYKQWLNIFNKVVNFLIEIGELEE